MAPSLKQTPARIWLPVAALIIFSALLAGLAGTHVRGTDDQYWYIADVEHLARGDQYTNNIYPATRFNSAGGLPFFCHHNPSLYAVVPAALFLGSYRGWIATNWLAALLAAGFVYLILRRNVPQLHAISGAILFAMMPVVVWQSCNALTEIQHAAALAAATYFVTSAHRKVVRYGAGVAAAVVAALMKDQLLLFLGSVCAYVCWQEYSCDEFGRWKRVLALACSSVAIVSLCLLLRVNYFHENVDYTLKARLLSSAMPLYDSSASWFTIGEVTITAEMIMDKVFRNIREALFTSGEVQLFLLPFNAGAVICLLAALKTADWKPADRNKEVMAFGLVYVAIYLMVTAGYQSQFRYCVAGLPVVVCTAFLYLYGRMGGRVLLGCVTAAIMVESLIALALVQRIYHQGIDQERIVENIREVVNTKVPDGRALLVERDPKRAGAYVMLAYALSPRVMAVFDRRYDVCGQIQSMRPYLGNSYGLLTIGTGMAGDAEPLELPVPYAQYALRIDARGWCSLR